MSPTAWKGLGIAALVVSAILLFVAWERYQDNARQVNAANTMMQSSPVSGLMNEMTGGVKLQPAVPTATKYALAFGVLFGVGGAVCLVLGFKKAPSGSPGRGLP